MEDERVTPRSAGRGQRVRTEVNRLHYVQPGKAVDGQMASSSRPRQRPEKEKSKAQSVNSSQSTASILIRQNRLEAEQKIADLRDEIDEETEEKEKLQADWQAAQQKVDTLEQEETTAAIKADIRDAKLTMITLQSEISKQESKIKRLEEKFQRRQRIIREEQDINNEVILEGNEDGGGSDNADGADSGESSEDEEEKNRRIVNWVQRTDDGINNIPERVVIPPVPQQQTDIALLANALKESIALSVNQPRQSYKDFELPTFTGKPEDWPMFLNEYERTKRPHQSENLRRLRKALKGTAEETVHHLLAKPENIPEIMLTLRKRFGQPKFILDSLAKKAKAAPPPNIAKPETIITFGIAVQALVTNIESYEQHSYLHSVDLLDALVRKLPPDLSRCWYTWLSSDSNREENLKSFCTWITIEVDMAYRRSDPCVQEDEKPARRNRHVGAATEVPEEGAKPKKTDYCMKCKKEGHHIRDCRSFASLTDDEKLNLVKEKRLCFSCLRSGHRTSECQSKKKCGIDGCSRRHHPSIHSCDKEKSKKEDRGPAAPINVIHENPDGDNATIGNLTSPDGDDLLWYVRVKVKGPKGEKSCIAMLDIGAQVSLIDEGLARELGLGGPWGKLNLGWFNGQTTEIESMFLNLEVAGDHSKAKYFPLKDVRSVDNVDMPSQSFSIENLKKKYSFLRGAPVKSMVNATPLLVIGTKQYSLCIPNQVIMGSPHLPAAIKTKFGWTIVGPAGKSGSGKKGLHSFFGPTITNEDLSRLTNEFVVNENFGADCPMMTPRSKEDQRALQILEKTTVFNGERYCTGLLWKDETLGMPESKSMALKRLYSIEKKADRNPVFAELYTSRFTDYIEKGYLKKVTIPANDSIKRWYLPQFFAFHPSKKPRLVFDAAAKSNGVSFNDHLVKGPDLLQSLAAVLMKFRRHNIGLTGDITQMFHQVQLRKEDQPAQTVLYRGMDRKAPPDTYQMTVLYFGSACSPCSAIYAKDSHARKYEAEYPEAVEAITKETYMDDMLTGGKTVEEAIKLQQETTLINSSGGFPIGKFLSSSVEVLKAIPNELRANQEKQITSKSDLGVEKTLGIFWDQAADEFRFKLDLSKLPQDVRSRKRLPTKREIASFIMSLFDPLGFLLPLKIKGLVIFQNCWKLKIDWDAEVTDSINEKFLDWINELEQINNLSIPRCYSKDIHRSRVQLHIFCDASEEAFAAAAYLRVDTGGSIERAFVTSKGKIAKLRGLSIPRMELNAALLGARLSKCVLDSLGKDILFESIHFWTDSRTVLCWLQSDHGRFSQYVSNRVNEVLELSVVEQWNWVSTVDNVADEPTRSTKPITISSDSRWLNGPAFLLLDQSGWPKLTATALVNDEELEKRNVIMSTFHGQPAALELPLPNVKDYSSWWNLVWKTASWIRSFRVLVQKSSPTHVTSKDVEKAKLLWIKQVQQECFLSEMNLLKLKRDLPKSSKLCELSPFLNENGTTVMAGRLKKFGNISHRPSILDGRHAYVQLMILHHHNSNAHQGLETVLNSLRRDYWILGLRPAVKAAIKRCMSCRIRKAKPFPPEMAPIPDCRVAVNEPSFTHTGVDLFGPYEIAIGRRTEKRWGILFTCMTTRAIYIDLVPSLSSSDVIDALVRFSARRGPPRHLYSDQGTNFRGADKEITECYAKFNSADMSRTLLEKQWDWHFNCPAASHMGGSWERMIGLTKRILQQLMKEKRPKEYTLLTFLAEAENILNNRPLTFVSADPTDESAITPNHLLKLRVADSNIVPGTFADAGYGRKMWRVAQQLADDFWKQWTEAALPLLNKRPKWNAKTTPIKIGDIVLIADDQNARNSWKKGIVIDTYPGKDKVIRVVKVRVPIVEVGKGDVRFAEYKRPVNKLCILDLV